MKYRNPHERFWEKVNKNGPVPAFAPDLGSCWLWTAGQKSSNGGKYGNFRLPRQRKQISAHRWAWEELHRPLRPGETLDHLCRVTLCVRPDHLEPVSQRTNILSGTNRAAQFAKQTHCINGHPLSGDNLRIAKNGQRMCRECRRQWERERKARQRIGRADRRNKSKTHCKFGHPFDAENTYVTNTGARRCRTCNRIKALAHYRRLNS